MREADLSGQREIIVQENLALHAEEFIKKI